MHILIRFSRFIRARYCNISSDDEIEKKKVLSKLASASMRVDQRALLHVS